MSDNKLSFKISVNDDSKKGLNSATSHLKNYKKEIVDLLNKSKKTEDPFKKMGNQLKNVDKEFKKINQSQNKMSSAFKKMGGAGDSLADTLKNVNREDVVIAQKLAQKGKEMQLSKQQTSPAGYNAMQSAMQGGQGKTSNIQVLKVNKIEAKNFLGKTGSGPGNLSKAVSEKLSEKVDKNLSEGLGKIGAGIGMVAGGFVAAIGVTYSVMSAKASAFRQLANQQMRGLQQVGFGAQSGMVGQKTAGGFYSGFEGQGPGGSSYFLTGQQQVDMLSQYAKQTGANREQLNKMMYGTQGGMSVGALSQAYGIGPGQLAGSAGVLQRFSKGRETGTETLFRAMRGAEGVGMGGARMQEFLDSFQEAVTQGVMSGSERTNLSMLKGLETLMGTSNERLKALAPEILKSSTQTMNQAAMLGGGAQGNFMFQAVLNQQKKSGGQGNVFDVMEQLASGDWLKNAQAALAEASARSGGNKQWTAFNLMKGMGLNIASPQAQQEIAQMIEKGTMGGKPLSQEMFQQEVSKRLKDTAQIIDQTAKQDYLESLHSLSEANKDAAIAVTALREVITTIVDKGYELGKGAAQKFFGVNMNPQYPTENGYQ